MVMMDASKVPGQVDPWNNVLGMLGLFEPEDLGPGDCWAYVNAATGGLVLQFRDEHLSELTADLMPVRIYNSQGSGWQWGSAVSERVDRGQPNANVQYIYDLRGRLSAVKTMLNPGDAMPERSIDTYTYDHDSDRIESLSRSDDSCDTVTVVRFTYEQVGTSSTFRIKTVTDVSGTQTFIYHGGLEGRGRTDLVDVRGQTWTYVYDASTSQLLEVHSPSAIGERSVATFHYDGEAMSIG